MAIKTWQILRNVFSQLNAIFSLLNQTEFCVVVSAPILQIRVENSTMVSVPISDSGIGASLTFAMLSNSQTTVCRSFVMHVCMFVSLQAANSYLRDQWFHSLQWKVSYQRRWWAPSYPIGAPRASLPAMLSLFIQDFKIIIVHKRAHFVCHSDTSLCHSLGNR